METDIVFYYNFGKTFIDSHQLDNWYKDVKKLLATKEGKEILGFFVTALELYEDGSVYEIENIPFENLEIKKKAEKLLYKYGFGPQRLKTLHKISEDEISR